jgi:hypothetical protein
VLIRVIVILTLISVSTSAVATPEEAYFKARDRYIREFEKTPNPSKDGPALEKLEIRLREIFTPMTFEGFPGRGKINLLTLHKELGFGQVDGLRFDSGQQSILVTTHTLLAKYLDEHASFPKNIRALSKAPDFYRLAFSSDAAVTYFAEIAVESPKDQTFAHAFLGVTAQDIGPFVPSEIFVFVEKGSQIRLAYFPAAQQITDIPQCRSEWEKFEKKSSDALKTYRSSNLQNEKAFADSQRYEEQGFEAYRRCFGNEAKRQSFFAPLTKQTQSIVNLLLKN